MKQSLLVFLLLWATVIIVAVNLPATTKLEPFQVSGTTAAPRDVSVFVKVDVPRDLSFVCSDSEANSFTCRMVGDLVDLKSPAVDAILVKYHQVILRNGVVIFDYSKPDPRVP